MARARNKEELIDLSNREYGRLMKLVIMLSPKQREEEEVYKNRTVKDILAHLLAWQLLEKNWYEEGMEGKKPVIPAPGYTFKDTDALNEKLYSEYKADSWSNITSKLEESHNKLLAIINKHTDEELSTKKKYAWTGTTSMTSYFASALSSHYVWAIELIRKRFKDI